MSKPITDTLRMLQGGAFNHDAGEKLAGLVKGVEETGRAGKLTITIDIKKAGAAVQVLAAEKAKGAAQLKALIADAPAPAPHASAPQPAPAGPAVLLPRTSAIAAACASRSSHSVIVCSCRDVGRMRRTVSATPIARAAARGGLRKYQSGPGVHVSRRKPVKRVLPISRACRARRA